jgi:pantetheine-phosphate adenylyltransferase
MFRDVWVIVAHNEKKNCMFPYQRRVRMIQEDCPGVHVISCPDNQLLVDFLEDTGITVLARGVRESYDFQQELTMAHINERLSQGKIETIMVPTRKELSDVSSSAVKTIFRLRKDGIEHMVSKRVYEEMLKV